MNLSFASIHCNQLNQEIKLAKIGKENSMVISNETVAQIFCAYIAGRQAIDPDQLIDDVVQLVCDYKQIIELFGNDTPSSIKNVIEKSAEVGLKPDGFSQKVTESFADRLKRVRKQKGMTQYGLSLKSGIDRSTIGAYEIDIRLPSIWTLRRLSKALSVSTDYLLGISEEERN